MNTDPAGTRDFARRLAALSERERRSVLAGMSPVELETLEYTWSVWARPDQLPPPGDWRTWLLLGGRGSGKTRSASEWIRNEVETGRRRSIGIIGPTADTLRRDVVQGISGLIEVSPPWFKPTHEPSQRRIVWPNGAVAHLLSSEEPDRIRGPNLDAFFGDELTSWSNAVACWDNLQFALRISGPKGDAPAGVVSTTPKRGHVLMRSVKAEAATVTTSSKTADNGANLDKATLRYLQAKYGGTTVGRQELDAEILEDVDGALWSRALIDSSRVEPGNAPDYKRVVVAIDPAGGSGRKNDETGILVAARGADGHGYVLRDLSGRFSPERWARRAIEAYHAHRADRIVVEANFGGEMVVATIRAVDPNVPVKTVHASRGKQVRAEPVVAMYEQRRVHHVGNFPELEDQLCGWDPTESGSSPDRLDALVWAITELMIDDSGTMIVHKLPY
jgi:phage terminase large subunit-like protein